MSTNLLPQQYAVCPVSHQTPREELLSTLTHAFGLLLSVIGISVLIVYAGTYGEAIHVVTASIYGSSLVLLYAASTFYHGSRSLFWKRKLQVADHVCIYLLIAGTYTPITLISLKGVWGWSLFSIVWGVAIVGILLKLFFTGRFRVISTLAYLCLGWVVVIALGPLIESLPTGGLIWLVAGGLAYSFGTIFFVKQQIPFNHAIWHLFVMAGSACHYFSVFLYVIPPT